MDGLLLVSFSGVMTYVGYIAIAIMVLLVMIMVHEFGHYIAGKILGFTIDEFAIGFGPKLISKKKANGEVFSLRLFPLGGFCSFHGEDGEVTSDKDFNSKKPWKRIIVLVSGVFMNYLFSIILITIMFGAYGCSALVAYDIDYNADYTEYSFISKDVILKANGRNIYMLTDLMSATKNLEKDDTVEFFVIRDGKRQTVQIKLRCDTHYKSVEDNEKLYSALGLHYDLDSGGNIINSGFYSTGVKRNIFITIGKSFEYSGKVASSIFEILGQLITGSISIKSVGGTITTLSITANAIKVGGLRYLLNIASFIGVNLALFNILPIPALDGCRAVFTVIEWIRRKPINRKVENAIHNIGFILILAFAVFIDLQQLF